MGNHGEWSYHHSDGEGGRCTAARPGAVDRCSGTSSAALVVLGPLAFSVTVGLLVASVLPRPSAPVLARVGWSVVVMSASTLALVLAGRLARRLLPLSLLLRVGVVFPDAAPRRFGVALRAVRPGKGGDHTTRPRPSACWLPY